MAGDSTHHAAQRAAHHVDGAENLCVLGFGANLGDPAESFAKALGELDARAGRVESVSSIVRTPPWDGTDQPDYLNIVALLRTAWSAARVLAFARELERGAGRPERYPRWGARPLDIDIVLWFDAAGRGVAIDEPGLTVPHPRWRERAFVVWPLAEIAPDLIDPTTGETVTAIRDALARSGESPPDQIAPPAGWRWRATG